MSSPVPTDRFLLKGGCAADLWTMPRAPRYGASRYLPQMQALYGNGGDAPGRSDYAPSPVVAGRRLSLNHAVTYGTYIDHHGETACRSCASYGYHRLTCAESEHPAPRFEPEDHHPAFMTSALTNRRSLCMCAVTPRVRSAHEGLSASAGLDRRQANRTVSLTVCVARAGS